MSENHTLSEPILIKSIIGTTFPIEQGALKSSGYKSILELFNKNQKPELSEKYYPSGALEAKSYFDDGGISIKEVFFYENGEINYEYRYKKGENGNFISKTMFLGGNEKWNSIVSEFDSTNRKKLDKHINSDGKVLREDVYKYANDYLISIESGKMGYVKFYYNDSNQLIKKTVASPSNSESGENYLYFYNQMGLLERLICENESITEYEYTFYEK